MSSGGGNGASAHLRVIAAWNVLNAGTGAWLVRGGCSGQRPGDGAWDLHIYRGSTNAVPAAVTIPGLWSSGGRVPFKRMHLVYADRESFEARFESDAFPAGLHLAGTAGDDALRMMLVADGPVKSPPSVRIDLTNGAAISAATGTYADSLLIPSDSPRDRRPVAPLSGSVVLAEAVVTLG